MALTLDGKVFSWGEGEDGKLGKFVTFFFYSLYLFWLDKIVFCTYENICDGLRMPPTTLSDWSKTLIEIIEALTSNFLKMLWKILLPTYNSVVEFQSRFR